MQKIYKYRLPRDGQVVVINDNVAEFLHVGTQDGEPTVWAVVDLDRDYKRECEIVAWGTGWDLPDEVWIDYDYIGTCEDGYGYVWHYFVRFKDAEPRADADVSTHHVIAAAADYALPKGWSDGISVTLDREILDRILGTTEANWAVNDTITYVTSNCADTAHATEVTFART